MALRDLVQQYGIRFKKQLGQNLLLDDNINRIMVEAAALTPEDFVIEVGAGLGALTANLAEGAGRVLAIEIDRAFFAVFPHDQTPAIAVFFDANGGRNGYGGLET